MKWIIYLSTLFLVACESPVIFEEPQPGYLCTGDSSILKIREKVIYQERAYFFVDDVDGSGLDSLMHKEEVMTEGGIETLYFLEGEPVPLENVLLTDDVFLGTLLVRDTLFSISDRQKVRYYRGHLVLNEQRSDLRWDVALVSQEINGDLRLSVAKEPEEVMEIERITPVKKQLATDGSDQLVLNPSRGEFRQLVRKELLFEECA